MVDIQPACRRAADAQQLVARGHHFVVVDDSSDEIADTVDKSDVSIDGG